MKHIAIFTGGLGNQMFEYAFLLALRAKGHKVTIDISFYDYLQMHNGYELERVFGIYEKTIRKGGLHLFFLRVLDRIKPRLFYTEDILRFNKEVLDTPKRYIRGCWQNELYFKDIEPKIRKVFNFQSIDKKNEELANKMNGANSVSLHVRRGDYASFGMQIVGAEFYKQAISIMNSKVNSPVYYVFSDDNDEAKKIMDNMNVKYCIINHNEGDDSYKDMFLMSQCKHNIIANSSFSWWGAWLNNNPEKIVIAPKWLTDFNCKDWIEL